MNKFEYKTIPFSRKSIWEGGQIDISQLETVLAQMGQEGWELVTTIEGSKDEINRSFFLIFKRLIEN